MSGKMELESFKEAEMVNTPINNEEATPSTSNKPSVPQVSLSDLFTRQGKKLEVGKTSPTSLSPLKSSLTSTAGAGGGSKISVTDSTPNINPLEGGYTRFFSPVDNSFFWKKEGAFDIIREGERLGQWECFFEASTGQYFYKNTLTSEVSYSHPEDIAELDALKKKDKKENKTWGLVKGIFKDDKVDENAEWQPPEEEKEGEGEGDGEGEEEGIIKKQPPVKGKRKGEKGGGPDHDRRKSYAKLLKIADLDDRIGKSSFEDNSDDEEVCVMYKNGRLVVPFNPTDHQRLYWDLFVIIPVLAYLCVAMPFTMGFNYTPVGPHAVFETCLDLIFCFDIIISFMTGYIVQGEEDMEDLIEYDAKKVAVHYMKSWFIPDLISALPMDLLLNLNGADNFQYVKLVKSGKALKALRLVRVFKIAKVAKSVRGLGVNLMDENKVDQIEELFSNNFTRSAIMLLTITLQLCYINHLLCCVWVFVGRQGDIEGSNNWLKEEGYEAKDTETHSKDLTYIYVTALYFCCTTMTSVGYGDYLPYNLREKIFCIVAQVTGGFVYAMIIASLTAVVTFQESNDRIKHEKMSQVVSYINIRRFPKKLSRRIRRHFRELFESQVAVDETAILNQLSSDLRVEVSQYLIAEMMEDISPFKEMSPLQWSIILPLLKPFVFAHQQLICTQGDFCVDTYIVIDGKLQGTCSAKRLNALLSGDSLRNSNMNVRSRFATSSRGTVYPMYKPPSYIDEDDVKQRPISSGETINVLCMLGIWEFCVETVVALENGDSYMINSKDFIENFSKHSVFESLRDHTSSTMFEMAKDPDAPTKYGVPLYPYREEEVLVRDADYSKRKSVEKNASYKQLTMNMKLKLKAQKIKETDQFFLHRNNTNTGKLSSKSVISKLRLKGSNQMSSVQQAEEVNRRMKRKQKVLAAINDSIQNTPQQGFNAIRDTLTKRSSGRGSGSGGVTSAFGVSLSALSSFDSPAKQNKAASSAAVGVSGGGGASNLSLETGGTAPSPSIHSKLFSHPSPQVPVNASGKVAPAPMNS